MASHSMDMDGFVTALLPSLSKSLAEQFNIFRVMRHGTHEKQLSNIFSWLLTTDATHGLEDTFQLIFLARINAVLPAGGTLPDSGYRVVQEVDTRATEEIAAGAVMDIADIVLSRPDAAVVVENFETSDGHGHDYQRYLAHGTAGGRPAAVVLLCHRHDFHRLRNGWEQAIVITYADLLTELHAHVDGHRRWQDRHPDQLFFLRQMIEYFVEGPAAVNVDEQIRFIKTMCETGESARYGHRPQERAAQEFADLVAEHARRQFEDSRATLASVKDRLRTFARTVLTDQLNAYLSHGSIDKVATRFVGQWEWCVELQRRDELPAVFLEFGPTAVVENARIPLPLNDPDYSRVFVTLQAPTGEGISRITQTDVSLSGVLDGLEPDNLRLRDAVLSLIDNA